MSIGKRRVGSGRVKIKKETGKWLCESGAKKLRKGRFCASNLLTGKEVNLFYSALVLPKLPIHLPKNVPQGTSRLKQLW